MRAADSIRTAGRIAVALACCSTAAASAQPEPRPTSGTYAFEAFRVLPSAPALPAELRAGGLAGLTYGTHAVEFAWVGREHFSLRGYRLTATVEGGPLAGVAARWTVTPGSGRPSGAAGQRSYRVYLPIPTDGRLHVRALLEALGDGDAVVPLAQHDAVPQPEPQSRQMTSGSPRVLAGAVGGIACVTPRPAPAVQATWGDLQPLSSAARAVPVRACALQRSDIDPHAPRGPPAQA